MLGLPSCLLALPSRPLLLQLQTVAHPPAPLCAFSNKYYTTAVDSYMRVCVAMRHRAKLYFAHASLHACKCLLLDHRLLSAGRLREIGVGSRGLPCSI